MALSLRELRLVHHVARAGTLTAAARALHVTQSALSRQLTELERRIKTAVFLRTPKRMVPTAAGLRIVETAQRVLADVADLDEDLKKIAQGKRGRIRITATCYTCYHWLPEVLPAFGKLHPDIEVALVPAAAADALGSLFEGEVDLVLSYHPIEDDPALEYEPLFSDEQVVLVAPGHPLALNPWAEARDFEHEHLLVHYDRPEESLFFRTVLDPAGIRPARVTEVRLTEAILGLVAAGSGIAVLTRWTAAPEIRSGRVIAVRIGRFGLRRDWNAVTLRTEKPPRYLEDFEALLARGPDRLFDDPGRIVDRKEAGIVVPGG